MLNRNVFVDHWSLVICQLIHTGIQINQMVISSWPLICHQDKGIDEACNCKEPCKILENHLKRLTLNIHCDCTCDDNIANQCTVSFLDVVPCWGKIIPLTPSTDVWNLSQSIIRSAADERADTRADGKSFRIRLSSLQGYRGGNVAI